MATPAFMNMGCFSYMVAMATVTRFLLKITANIIDKIWYYAETDKFHINTSALALGWVKYYMHD